MFFKAVAVLMAGVVGYFLLEVSPDYGPTSIMLPASAVAVLLLLGWSA